MRPCMYSLSMYWRAVFAVLGLLTASSPGTLIGASTTKSSQTPSQTGHSAYVYVYPSEPNQLYGRSCNVRDYGAVGDGVTSDTDAVAAALADLACGEVVFDGDGDAGAGVFRVGTLQLRSHLRLVVSPTATVLAIDKGEMAYDLHEDSPYAAYQDYGHSYFHDSLMWCDGCTNLTFGGGGTFDGGGALSTSQPSPGDACRMLALRSCTNVGLTNLTLQNGGWFALLANNVSDLVVRDVVINTDRDGIDLVSCNSVLVERVDVHSSDDAIAVKSDFALGVVLDSHTIVVRDARLISDTCNACQIGSETVGNFSNLAFSNIMIQGAGKAGIGIVSMDGAHVSGAVYENVTMSGVSNVIYMYIGARANERRPVPNVSAPMDSYVGSITNITIRNVVATDVAGSHGNFTLTLDGQPPMTYEADGVEVEEVHYVGPGLEIKNVSVTVKGGGVEADVMLNPPHSPTDYTPRSLGVRPSFALFLRRTLGIDIEEFTVAWETGAKDERPGVILDQCDSTAYPVVLGNCAAMPRDRLKVSYDVGLRNGSTFFQDGSTNLKVAHID